MKYWLLTWIFAIFLVFAAYPSPVHAIGESVPGGVVVGMMEEPVFDEQTGITTVELFAAIEAIDGGITFAAIGVGLVAL